MSPENYPEAKEIYLNRESIQRLAEAMARQLNFEPGGNLTTALTALGGKARYEDVWSPTVYSSGSLYVHGPNDFEISLPLDTTPERARFTIAHELGHYILHFAYKKAKGDKIEKMRAARYGSTQAEWEANWFAAAFLMPTREFRQKYKDLAGDIGKVAKHFAVSYSAAEVRAKSLKLL